MGQKYIDEDPDFLKKYLEQKYQLAQPPAPVSEPMNDRVITSAPEPVEAPVPPPAPTPSPDFLSQFKYKEDPEAMRRAEERADRKNIMGSIFTGLNTFTKGASGFDPGDAIPKQLFSEAEALPGKESSRQRMIREYLKDKAEMALKGKSLEKDSKMLEETLRHNRATEDIDKGRLTANVLKDQSERVQKKQDAVTEIESRRQTVNQNIEQLKKMIKEGGTYEAFGPHNEIMDSIVNDIATDMAKLKDPSSAARPGEVELEKASIIKSGMLQRNSTAMAKLDALEQRLNDRVANAYSVRGLPVPPTAGAPQAGKEMDGYVFKGGDPADKNNWVKK